MIAPRDLTGWTPPGSCLVVLGRAEAPLESLYRRGSLEPKSARRWSRRRQAFTSWTSWWLTRCACGWEWAARRTSLVNGIKACEDCSRMAAARRRAEPRSGPACDHW